MTIPAERTHAVLDTRAFLWRLANNPDPISLKDIRRQAAQLLRHYPSALELDRAGRIEAQHPHVSPVFASLEAFNLPGNTKHDGD